MNIQLKEIILWPQNKELEIKTINFVEGKVNVIHGLSQTGKSAIVHITDYCLCASENKIPIGIIRDSVDWFGIKLLCDDEEMLFIRKNLPKSGFCMQFEKGKNLETPIEPIQNVNNKDEFKKFINNIMGIPFFEENKEGTYSSRISFRDLVAFNFQTQSLVASPNCLLYKSDLSDYRDRLKKIFNVALGLETSQNMFNKIKSDALKKEQAKLELELEENKKYLAEQLLQHKDIILKAMKYGIIKQKALDDNAVNIRSLLEEIIKKKITDISLSFDGGDKIAKEILTLEKELRPLYNKLKDYELKKQSILKTINLLENTISLSNDRIERLQLSKFIKNFCLNNSQDSVVISNIDKLCKNLEEIENKNYISITNQSRNYKELAEVDEKIAETNDDINKILDMYKKLDKSKNVNIIEDFISDIAKAKNLLNFFKVKDESLLEKINNIKEDLSKYPYKEVKPYEALNKIITYTRDLLPDFVEFKNVSSFEVNDLTVKIKKSDNETPYYLSETGSASNWLAYHLAILLAFHKYFANNNCNVFNFIMFDQPSQVFFPNPSEMPQDLEELEARSHKDDIKSVIEIFKLFNEYINSTKEKVQIIVLDHADPKVWGNFENIMEIADWSKNNEGLIPQNWIS